MVSVKRKHHYLVYMAELWEALRKIVALKQAVCPETAAELQEERRLLIDNHLAPRRKKKHRQVTCTLIMLVHLSMEVMKVCTQDLHEKKTLVSVSLFLFDLNQFSDSTNQEMKEFCE